jgi:hypothetical protein
MNQALDFYKTLINKLEIEEWLEDAQIILQDAAILNNLISVVMLQNPLVEMIFL